MKGLLSVLGGLLPMLLLGMLYATQVPAETRSERSAVHDRYQTRQESLPHHEGRRPGPLAGEQRRGRGHEKTWGEAVMWDEYRRTMQKHSHIYHGGRLSDPYQLTPRTPVRPRPYPGHVSPRSTYRSTPQYGR